MVPYCRNVKFSAENFLSTDFPRVDKKGKVVKKGGWMGQAINKI